MTARVAVLVERYPQRSETFVERDLAAMIDAGLEVVVVACRSSDGSERVISPTGRLGDPRRLVRDTRDAFALLRPGPRRLASAVRLAGIAASLAERVARWSPSHIHAHFLGTPSVVGLLLAARLDLPFSISVHARDLFVPSVKITTVCRRARFIAACSEHARASLMGQLPEALRARVVLAPHAVPTAMARSTIARPADGIRMISVSRLVPKKGLDTVLRAIALVGDYPLTYRIIGDGPELASLHRLAETLGVTRRVGFAGALAPSAIGAELAAADLFVLGCRIAPDGDRDGIPNAILEAMAAGVPVIAGDAGGVGEVIAHGRTGWLARPDAPASFASVIREACADPALRARIANRAHEMAMRSTHGTLSLAMLFGPA